MSARNPAALLILATTLFAQSMGTGTITGAVTDATGAFAPGVRISALNLSTGIERAAVTDASGSYTIPALQIGAYEVRATHAGFKTFVQKDVRLDVDTSVTIN